MNEPICNFKNDEEMRKSLAEWQHRLFLDDWIINICRLSQDDMESSEDVAGEIITAFSIHTAKIHLLDEPPDDVIGRYCEEQTLVHELLHLKMNILIRSDTYEAKYLDVHEHAELDKMSKSLIMAKYGIDFSWFKNF